MTAPVSATRIPEVSATRIAKVSATRIRVAGTRWGQVAVIVGVILYTGAAAAHTLSDGHVEIRVEGSEIGGRVTLAASDLHEAVGIDDGDGRLTWAEVEKRASEIRAYVGQRVTMRSEGGVCGVEMGALSAIDRVDGTHVAVEVTARCPGKAEPVVLGYRAMFDVDATHRGLVTMEGEEGMAVAIVSGPGEVKLDGGDGVGVMGFVREGVWHIWIGLDHVLFLVALLLPAVYRREGLKAVAIDVMEIVTAFTLAHSITLIVASAGWVTLPPRFIETAIAISVALAAANNLVRVVDARWAVAFALGLLHGFGFSSVLADLGLPGDGLVAALLGFNLGVEIGQAAIVLVFLPLAYAVRRTAAYRAVLIGGSAATVLLAVHWSIDRLTT